MHHGRCGRTTVADVMITNVVSVGPDIGCHDVTKPRDLGP